MKNIRVEITAELVAAMLREQHPDLASLPLSLGAVGWDNQLWRLGENLAVRLPWATDDAEDLLIKENSLLPDLSLRLPLPIPIPQRLGRPSDLFPRSWIVTTWVHGEPADRTPATDGNKAADNLGAFLSALHEPAPSTAPKGRHGRGGSLAACSGGVAHLLSLATERGLLCDPEKVWDVWKHAAAAPDWSGQAKWIHADLHPANLLTRDGTFCGVIDFGDLCAGDPACDLGAAWLLLPDGAISRFYEQYVPEADEANMRRARGWAISKALVCLIIGDDGFHGRPGGKSTWAPPALAAIRRLTSTAS
ncbi:aminoglycoside phosphotransferase family protein [Oryzifoliimicrobium ureilyticus]|uniref:aminoglycoside phosphotransferase family protein n=1 Tax=Oryzifoliimicrobium ureilyticus TaxID=3113724 RepID=UPI003075FC2A